MNRVPKIVLYHGLRLVHRLGFVFFVYVFLPQGILMFIPIESVQRAVQQSTAITSHDGLQS